MSNFFRTLISGLLVAFISTGNSLQIAISEGKEPSKWQVYSAVLGGVILFFNDIKSRITPTKGEKNE